MPQRLALVALLVWLPMAAQAAPRQDSDADAAPATRRGFPRMLVDRDVRPAGHEQVIEATSSAAENPADRAASARPRLRAADEDAPTPLSPRGQDQPLRLAPPGEASPGSAGRSGAAAIGTALGSLAVVLALFFGVAWVLRRGMPAAGQALPRDVLEVLGRSPLPGRQQVHLLRLGNKLLLVWASGQAVETLAEVTDPQEVDRLTGLCQQAHPSSASNAFRQVFQQFAGERGGRSPATSREALRRPQVTADKWHAAAAVEDDDA
jgi:flagellar biogenesis protein FliO